ncbi:MAG: prolyl oligopeptidase family serine peptidase [Simplicispira sp.]|nr:prolyl oligopeptidase family serine peptidase [Simplicispira sp.]
MTAKPGVFSPEPMLFVHGDADDYAYISDCRSYAQRIAAAGTPTEFVVVPGARHKFDAGGRRINLPSNPRPRKALLEFDIVDLKYRDRRSGEVPPGRPGAWP